MTSTDNPLLQYDFDVAFDRVRAEHVRPAVRHHLQVAREALDAIAQHQGPRTYDNTLGALDTATEPLEYTMSLVGHLESVATTDALREAYNDVLPEVTEFYAGIVLDEKLYAALREFAESDEGRALTGPRKRFLKQTLDDFRRDGAELDEPGKQRLRELSVELSQLTTKFSQQLLDATQEFSIVLPDRTRLGGLPESALDAAEQSARAKGQQGYRFTLQQPSYVAVLTYADDVALREQMYRAYNSRATTPERDNPTLIREILRLRREKAALLGYANFADLVLEDRMAKRGEDARAFVEDLERKTRPHFERENAELAAFRQELEGPNAPPLVPWDVPYYAEKMRKARFDFDEEQLRPYFSVDAVLEGMFSLVGRIYGIRVERREEAAVYHPDVRYYVVIGESDEELGSFYADLYPRENKRGGAWMADFITGIVGGAHNRHLGVMCANASPPVGGKPALLTHRDVETLFHEFGHLLHHLLGRAQVRSLAGTRVAWDFVELPSMIMENFCWAREALDLFAKHWQTGEPIPDSLFDRLLSTRTYRAANMQMRQLGFGTVDLALHMDFDPDGDQDVLRFAREIAERFSATPLPEDYAMIAGFGHLFASPVGYAAGYYSYKWAEVLEADAFSRFQQAGVLSREVGDEFRQRILSRGNEADPMELYKEFMGREPRVEALLERSGLVY